ncbi:hypothetical protein HDE70_000231 [Pedobacter cryoconitis]|nr:hypothetical protein [Pedobacter cryoconitis]
MLPIRINYDENGDPALTVEKECSIRFFDVFENEYEQRIFYYWDNDNAMVSISPAKLIKGH